MKSPQDVVMKIGDYVVAHISPDEGDALQAVFEKCTDYFQLVTGLPPGPAEANSTFMVVPEGKGYEDKLLLGIYKARELIGCLDVIKDYPQAGTWSLGLMMLIPEYRNRGLGRQVYQGFEGWAAGEGATAIRLGVVEQNAGAYRFWQRLGFATVERKRMTFGRRENDVLVMVKHLGGSSGARERMRPPTPAR